MAQSDMYEHYKELSQRAEYFLVGILAASAAFFWKAEEPGKLGMDPMTLHLAGLLLIFGAIVTAVVRLHHQPTIFWYMARENQLEGERGSLVKAASQGQTVVGGSLGVLTPEQQIVHIQRLDNELDAFRASREKLNTKLVGQYKLRNRLMVLGYLAFIAERIWIPYLAK